MRIRQHLRSDSSLSSTTDLHRSMGPPSDRHSAVNKYVYEGQNGKRDRDANAYPFRRLAHHNAGSASNLQAQKPSTAMDDSQQQQSAANDGSSVQIHPDVGLGLAMFPDLRDAAHMPPPPIPPSRVRGDRRTSTSSSTNASALTGFNSSRVPPAWGHVLSNVPTHANSTAMHSRQGSGGNASRYAGSSVYSSRYGGATGSGVGFGYGAHGGQGMTGATGKAYEPSSVYSTRANSPSLDGSESGVGTGSGTPQPSVFSGVAESGTGTGTGSQSGSGMRKSGYEIFEMPKDLDESEEETRDEQTVVDRVNADESRMPGAYPPTPGPFDSVETEGEATDTFDQDVDADGKEQRQECGCESPSEISVYETPDTTAVDLHDPPPESAPSPTAIMIQCPQSPPPGERTPLQPKSVKKNRSAMNLLGLQNALKPSLEHRESRRKSVGAKLSGFNIFRSKTMSNLRRAASLARAGAQEANEDVEKTPLAQSEDRLDDSEAADSKDLAVDGPTDRRGSAGTQALRHGVERHDRGREYDDYDDDDERRHHHHHHHHDSAARDADPVPLEDRKPGHRSRIRDSLSPTSGSANQAAMWERALQVHREEKSALFLSPEKGGKAKSQSLFRERSGSGSALRAKPIDEKQDGQKRPRSTEPPSNAWSGFGGFGERGESSQAGAKFRRSETVLLDPLDSDLGKSRPSLHAPAGSKKGKTAFLGDELKTGHVPEAASISPCTSPAPTPDDEAPLARARTWDEADASAMNLGDLGAWSRYPSHTRDVRNNSAGHTDEVHTRDFAYEIRLSEIAESEDGGETGAGDQMSRSPTGYKRVGTLGSASFKRRGKNKSSRGSLPKSKSMTFGRSFLKHYIGLFRSQSEEFRRHGHGHRSSVAEGGILEHPELEILPPVWSPAPIMLEPVPRESAEVEAGHAVIKGGGDGAGDEREQDQDQNKGEQLVQEGHAIGGEEKGNSAQESILDENKPDNKVEFELPEASNKLSRLERKTGSSEASWKADARLWSKLCNSESMSPLGVSQESLVEHGVSSVPPYDRKAERSSEWQRNVRLWTCLADRSQEFNAAVQHEAEASHLRDTDLDVNDAVDLTNRAPGSSEYANQSTSPLPRSSDEWRRDARLFSQMYESCVGLPQFGSTEDVNANGSAIKTGEQHRYQHVKNNSSSGLRAASAGVIDGLVMGRENAHPASAARWRTLSGGDAATYGGPGHFKNESAVSMASLRRSTWDMMKVLD
ncbi:uncharacterized protein J3D65DRAFT_612959 [Phyllosticta citribraziliensis]|uniref:Uncharacterized protein n=1 Tax=Phyllosticta citribraziliensis TaxID=989973 RepID=A0ABR1M3N2_9PEZI